MSGVRRCSARTDTGKPARVHPSSRKSRRSRDYPGPPSVNHPLTDDLDSVTLVCYSFVILRSCVRSIVQASWGWTADDGRCIAASRWSSRDQSRFPLFVIPAKAGTQYTQRAGVGWLTLESANSAAEVQPVLASTAMAGAEGKRNDQHPYDPSAAARGGRLPRSGTTASRRTAAGTAAAAPTS